MGPVTQEPIPERIVIKVPKRAPAPAAPPPEPEKPKGRGLLSNLPTASDTFDDIWEFTKSIAQIFPDMGKLLFSQGPSEHWKDIKKAYTTKAGWEATKKIGWSMVPGSQIMDEGWGILKTKPFSAGVVELAAAIPLLGTMLKASGAIAKAAGAGAKAQKVIQAGRYLETLPATVARAAVDKAVGGTAKLFGSEWSLPKRREMLTIKAEAEAPNAKFHEDMGLKYRNTIGAMSPKEREQTLRMARLGPTAEEVKAYPKAMAFMDLNDEVTTAMAKAQNDRDLLTSGRRLGALSKKYAEEMGWELTSKNIANAARAIKANVAAGGRMPTYLPHVPKKGAGGMLVGEVLSDMVASGRPVRSGNSVNSYKAMEGGGDYTRDLGKIVGVMLDDHRRSMNKLNLVERLRANPDLIKGSGKPLDAEMFHGVWKTIFSDTARKEGLKHITDPTIKSLLSWEFPTHPKKIVRAYDILQGWFSKQATRWNPAFHIGNIYTSAIWQVLFGGDPVLGKKLQEVMPTRITVKQGMGASDFGKLPGFLETKVDIAGGADQIGRMGMVGARTVADLKRFAPAAEQSMKSLAEVLQSTDDFNRLQIELTLLRDTIARRSGAVAAFDAQIAPLLQKEKALSGALGNFEAISKTAPAKGLPTGKDWEDAGQRGGFKPKAGGLKKPAQGREEIEDLRQKIVNLEARKQALIGDLTANKLKIAEREGRIPELKPMVDIVRKNVGYANSFFGEYAALDGFEQAVIRRVIPFYAWSKAMTMLAFRLPFIAPVKSFMWHRFAETMQTVANDPDLPPRLKGYIPVGALKDGRTVWVNVGRYSPVNNLRGSRIGGVPVPGMMNVVERNPLLSLMFSFHGGKTLWNVGNIPAGEQVVTMGDGTVARMGSDGLLHEEITQTPLISGAVNYFPVVQYAKAVLQPYWTNKYNWAGIPQPILNSDGTNRFPRDWMERVGAFLGVSTSVRSKEDFIRSEQMKVRKFIKNFSRAYAQEDDDGKAFLLQAANDYRDMGKYRHFGER